MEILCNSCAAFSVCSAIFPLPRAAAFVDNQTSSVDRREGPVTAPATIRGTGKSGEQLGRSPRLNNIQESGGVAAVALFSTAFPHLVEMQRSSICGLQP